MDRKERYRGVLQAMTKGDEGDMSEMAETTASTGRSGVRWVLVGGVLLVTALGAFTAVRFKQAVTKRDAVASARVAAQGESRKVAPVPVTHPKPAVWLPRVEVTGTLKPWREADVGFQIGGRLARVLVSVGDRVQNDQPLAFLDADVASGAVAIRTASSKAAAANVALAEDNFRRLEALSSTHSVAEAQVEQARQQVALARAQLQTALADTRLAQTSVGHTALRAPFNGIVTRAPTAPGSVVAPGTPLFRIEDLSRFRLVATVGEDDVPLVQSGSRVVVVYRSESVPARVLTLVPSLDPMTRRAPLEIEVPRKEGLLGYSFVHAFVESDTPVAAVRVPATAGRPGSQNDVVTCVQGKAKVVRVVHAVDTDGTWIVRQGLSISDTVLVAPKAEVKDGDVIADTELLP